MRRRKGTRSLRRLPRAPQHLPATGLLCCPMAPTPHRYTAVKYTSGSVSRPCKTAAGLLVYPSYGIGGLSSAVYPYFGAGVLGAG